MNTPNNAENASSSSQLRKATTGLLPNFGTETRASLSTLVAAFAAAEREVGEAADAEDAIHYKPASIAVRGGVRPATVIATEGKKPVTIPASDWFYQSREAIERDLALQLADAPADDRAGIEERFASLLRECDAQIDAIKRAVPKGKSKAKRRLEKAHRALTTAEDKIVNYKPVNMNEAAALLEYASRGTRYCFTVDERDLHTIMRNAASTIRSAQ